jgi:Family of unknown function (DUF6236)
MQRLLYYPMVNPPTPVIWQGLLYWDGIASITPPSDDYYKPLLRDLSSTPLYQPLFADKLGSDRYYKQMVRELQAVLGEMPGEDLEPEPGPLDGTNRLYYGKLPKVIQDDLIEIGAAQDVGPALQVNPRLLLAILAVAAKYLAQAYADDTTTYLPHTDQSRAHRIAFDPLVGAGGGQRCWQLEVGAALPVPAPDTSLEEVLRFRDDYEDERARLRVALYRLFKELEDIGNPADLQAAVALEITDAVRDLEAALRGRRLVWIKRGLYALVGLGAAAGAAHVSEVSVPAMVGSGIAINLATSQTRNQVPGQFAYLHHLHKTFPSATPPP